LNDLFRVMSRPLIVAAGLPPGHPKVENSGYDPETIRAGIVKSRQLIAEAGYDLQGFFPTPEGGIAQFVEYLKEHKPAGVVIGYGVRGSRELSYFFEDLVNAVVENAPGAKLMFNVNPESTVEHIKRLIPIK